MNKSRLTVVPEAMMVGKYLQIKSLERCKHPGAFAGLGVYLLAVLVLLGAAWPASAVGRNQELVLSEAEASRLDPFEAHSLAKADKLFPLDRRRDLKVSTLRAAGAAYRAFRTEFPRSKVLPYVLLREARCLHLEEKRNEAIKAYNEILDYFPNSIRYAAAALYYIGECHWQNGDEDEALKAWAEMAEDVDYSKSRFAATAINQLADALAERGDPDRAVKYWRQLALEFRTSNENEANAAIQKVARHHIRTSPDERALRNFYREVGTFSGRPQPIDEELDLAGSTKYWDVVVDLVKRHGRFPSDKEAEARRYFGYWSKVMASRPTEWDDLHLARLAFKLLADGDRAAWVKAVDAQYHANAEPEDYQRVIRWLSIFRGEPEMVKAYYPRLNFTRMSNEQIIEMMLVAYEAIGNQEMGRRIFGQIRFGELDDDALVELAGSLSQLDAASAESLFGRMADKDRAAFELLSFYASTKQAEKAIAQAAACTKLPMYANASHLIQAEMHELLGQYRKAIASYQSYRPEKEGDPSNLFAIASCYEKLGEVGRAVQQLEEVEAFFPKSSAKAAMRIADLYGRANLKAKQVAKLRMVMKKYPESGPSRQAHFDLEKMGLGDIISGGVKDPDS